jgi:hypothetical protein
MTQLAMPSRRPQCQFRDRQTATKAIDDLGEANHAAQQVVAAIRDDYPDLAKSLRDFGKYIFFSVLSWVHDRY